MLLASENLFLEKYNSCPDLQIELNDGKDLVIEEKSGERVEIIIPKNKTFEDQKNTVINQVECEIPHSEVENINCQDPFADEINKTGLKELNPYYILQGCNFSPSRICNIGEIIGSESLSGLVSDSNIHPELFSLGCQESSNCHDLKVLSSEIDSLKPDHSQHKQLSNLHFHPSFSMFGEVIQDNGPRVVHTQCYQHQIRSSGLDKFTAVDRNGKRSILHEVETQAQLMPSIPGVYFDRRQIGYRVRYHNSYVGWVALSRHSSIKDAYEYAKQLWLKARNKSKMSKCQADQIEVENRGMGIRKRTRFTINDENQELDQTVLCKPGASNENNIYFDSNHIENSPIFQTKCYNPEYSSRNDDYGVHPIVENEYNFSGSAITKQSLEQEISSELSKISQYSALETMRKFYYATQEYIEKWPSSDGHYTIHWSNTSDLSSYLYGEDYEQNHKRDFTSKKSKNQRKMYIHSEKQNINLDSLNINKQLESFNYIW
ncbi:uncharacterized protein ELE39_002418 [Cryptosporidium sp. chipmunk genotype I]|uniref:uncharacterized protein n=1 Tax=Cryptosporidium sp. chipmunk genotype I TaxID=1280935 RepID=UPI00351A3071|nr:hypothetical protein ELE39_002418 [Cryptosporidium sp. chipmunk genotype I]